MTDYPTPTGTAGTLIIRDNGTTVSFLIESRSSATYTYGKPWSGVVNGVNVSGSFDIRGATTITVGSWSVGYSQTVTFTMGATNTSGLGGPTTAQQFISRASAPSPPGQPTYPSISTNAVEVTWAPSTSDGGATITAYLLRRNTRQPVESPGYVDSQEANIWRTSAGLAPATAYYFRAYSYNAAGYYSTGSTESGVTTLPVPAVNLTAGKPTTTTIPVSWHYGTNGSQLLGYDVQYALEDDFSDGQIVQIGNALSTVLTDLRPGRTYNIRIRSKTYAAVSEWSAPIQAATIASLLVSDGTTWQPAEVYISDGTTWQPAEVYISDGTTWIVPG